MRSLCCCSCVYVLNIVTPVPPQEVAPRWSEYQSRFSSLLQWSRQHTALMADKTFPQNPVELKVSRATRDPAKRTLELRWDFWICCYYYYY